MSRVLNVKVTAGDMPHRTVLTFPSVEDQAAFWKALAESGKSHIPLSLAGAYIGTYKLEAELRIPDTEEDK